MSGLEKHALTEQLKHEQDPLLLILPLKTAPHIWKVHPQLISDSAKTLVKNLTMLTPRGKVTAWQKMEAWSSNAALFW